MAQVSKRAMAEDDDSPIRDANFADSVRLMKAYWRITDSVVRAGVLDFIEILADRFGTNSDPQQPHV